MATIRTKMWKILLLTVLFSNYIGIEVSSQDFGDNWKAENPDDNDFVRKNETNLEGIPKFLRHPDSVYYVYEGRAARITCIAEPVTHVNIICNKVIYSYMDKEVSESNLRVKKMNKQNLTDPHGDRWQFSLDISYNQVMEWFNTFSCVCEAWNLITPLSQTKKIHSNYSIIKEAFFKTKFRKSPQSTTLQKGQRLILACVPPDSKPKSYVQWMKDGERVYDNGRVKIVDEYQLMIDSVVMSDFGNYSCTAISLKEKRYSPTAIVKIQESIWTEWSQWSPCGSNCKKVRTRSCHQTNSCKGVVEQIEWCPGDCEVNKALAPGLKIGVTSGAYIIASPASNNDARDIAMYVGLFVAVSVLVMVITVVFCLIRRKTLSPLRSSLRHAIDLHENGVDCNVKNNLMKKPNIVTIKNQNAVSMNQRYISKSPPNLPPPNFFSDVSSNDPYSTGIEQSYNNSSVNFSQPLISNSSSVSTTNKSKVTASSNTDVKKTPLGHSETPVNSRPTSALYNDLSLDGESLNNSPPFVLENIDISTLSWAMITSVGGRLCLPQSGVTLTIMNDSCIENAEMYLAVSRNDPDPPPLADNETLLSPIVLFGPVNVHLLKPCVLSIPHSADLKQGNWVIRLMSYTNSDHDSHSVWKNISTIGCETDATPIYTHLDPYSAHILTNKCQKICLVGQSYPGGKATKRLRLAAFGRPLPNNTYLSTYNIRIYVFSDTKEAFESVSTIEIKMGSTLLDNTHQIIFSDGLGNLFFCIEELSTGWRSQLTSKYQEIPFQDIWSGTQSETLHCAFTFDIVDPSQQSFMCRITAYQSGFYNHKQTISIKQDQSEHSNHKRDLIQHEKLLLHSETNNTYLNPLLTVFRISGTTRKRLCVLMDNVSPRGNDWRMLSRQLNLNGYTNFFSNKVSPTDAILTVWEARNRTETALIDLINTFKAIGRFDCASVMESDCLSS